MAKRRKNVALPGNLRGTLARNLETVMQKVPALGSQPKIAVKGKLGQSSVGRVLRAEVAVNLDNLEGLAKAANLKPWQLLVPELDPMNPPRIDARGLKNDELELLAKYREASGLWQISLRYMAGLKDPNEQVEVAEGVNVLIAKTLGGKAYPPERMGPEK